MVTITRLAEDLFVYHGVVNVGIVRSGERALLIDCGDEGVCDALRELGVSQVDRLLFTHHHRDQALGIYAIATPGLVVGVPAAERRWFADVESYWEDPAQRWHLYGFRPHHLMLPRSITVHEAYRGGETKVWGGARIAVIETPGHTDGSVSYQVDLEGGRFTFCGDVLYGEGQIWDLHSLQKGWTTRDYHGFMGDHARLIDSLRALRATDPAALVPSHGPIVREPSRAVDLLCERLLGAYEMYVGISALRHYFPDLFAEFQIERMHGEPVDPNPETGSTICWRPGMMPVRRGGAYPAFLRHVGTTWIVRSEDGAALVVDCGSQDVVRHIQRMQRDGEIGAVEWLWITHYHDDHVDAIPQFREAFDCPVVADEHVARVVEDPLAWRLPCISPVTVDVDRHTTSGEAWRWHEYEITAYHLPGQTLYHGGLLVEGHGQRVLFAGDSFTMAGIDDYCPANRNPLGPGVGFDACLGLVEVLQPDVILNCHVDRAFDFTLEECTFMRANLAERECLYRELLPWDHPDYGLDEHWIRAHPYEQHVEPGENVHLAVVITNYSSVTHRAACLPLLPPAWGVTIEPRTIAVPSRAEGQAHLTFSVPEDVPAGRWVVPIDITYDGRRLGPIQEAVIVVSGGHV